MTTLANFTTSTTWTELTGVSGVSSDFTIQNIGSGICLMLL